MKTPPDLVVVKASGEEEPYSRDKLAASLARTNVPVEFRDPAIEHVETRLYPGIKTKEIYTNLRKFLKRSHRESASRYSIKQALFQLGPSGYPFEAFIGALFAKLGYQVELNQIVQGKCVTHEVDVIAEKEDKHFVVECKYHQRQGIKTDVKVALYVWARFEDIIEEWRENPRHRRKFHQPWLVTNTRCTLDAYQFGRCRGLQVISWDKPSGEGLRELINQTGILPIACLATLPSSARRNLIEKGIVHVQRFLETDPKLLRELPEKVLDRAREEAKFLLG